MPDARDNARGIAAMNIAMFAFVANDSFLKAASADLSLPQIVTLRGLVASTLVVGYCLVTGVWRQWGGLRHRLIAYRLVGEVGATMFYLIGLIHMPIGNASAIFQVTPLAVTAGAAIFLREPVGWRRWTAIAVGFAGVLVVIRPGLAGFDAAAFWILAAVGFVVLRDLSTARLPVGLPVSLTTASTAVTIMLCGLILSPFGGAVSPVADWKPLTLRLAGMITGSGIFLLVGYVFLIQAMRSGDMAVVAPFRYSLLLWSFAIGMVFFGERPDLWTYLGAGIVVATGLYTFQRERVRLRLAAAARPVTGATAPGAAIR